MTECMGVFSWVALGIRTIGGGLQIAGFIIVAARLFDVQRDAGYRPIPDRVRRWALARWYRLRRKDVGYGRVSHVRFEVPAPTPPPHFAPPPPDARPESRLDQLERHTAVQDDAMTKAREDMRQHQEQHRRRDEAVRTQRGEEQATQRESTSRELFAVILFGCGVLLATWPDFIYCAVGRVL